MNVRYMNKMIHYPSKFGKWCIKQDSTDFLPQDFSNPLICSMHWESLRQGYSLQCFPNMLGHWNLLSQNR